MSEHVVGRQYIEARILQNPVGMIERHTESRPRAAVVTRREKLRETEVLHHLDLVECHPPERIVAVVLASARLAAVAIAAQIGGHDGKVLCETRRNQMPVNVRER